MSKLRRTNGFGYVRREKLIARNRSRAMRRKSSERMRAWHSNPNFKPHLTHGRSHDPIYFCWASMIQRCTNANHGAWVNYGGANPPVRVCERWRGKHGFENFLTDMGERPAGTTLGRYLDIGNYEKRNCEWQTDADQIAERKGKRAMLLIHELHQSVDSATSQTNSARNRDAQTSQTSDSSRALEACESRMNRADDL
jgi:hypothetical protein